MLVFWVMQSLRQHQAVECGKRRSPAEVDFALECLALYYEKVSIAASARSMFSDVKLPFMVGLNKRGPHRGVDKACRLL